MSKEHYAINLDQLKCLVTFINAKKLNEAIIEDFNSTYELQIDRLSPKSLYQTAEAIEKRIKKQFFSEVGFTKAQLINQWHLGEKTLLFCTLIYYITLKKISIQSIMKKDLAPIKKIFMNKDISLLHFQAKHLLSKTMLKKNEWKEEDIEILKDIMMSKKEEFMKNEKCFRWKEVSFQIFQRSNTGEFYSAKDCRQKWLNHLNPQLLKTTWSQKEDLELFIALNEFGCKWSLISKKTGGLRTEHMIKNRANAIIKKIFKKKLRKIESKHINLVIESLREQGLGISQEIKEDSNQNEAQIKKVDSSDISHDDMQMEAEVNSVEVVGKQINFFECDDTYNRLLIQNVEDQWEYNEQNNPFDFLEGNQFRYHDNLLSYFQ